MNDMMREIIKLTSIYSIAPFDEWAGKNFWANAPCIGMIERVLRMLASKGTCSQSHNLDFPLGVNHMHYTSKSYPAMLFSPAMPF